MDIFDILFFISSGFIGASFASFIHVCVIRIHNNESFIAARSHCDKCRKEIKFYDLIPIISVIILKGRCRFCKTKIPIEGFLFETFLFFVTAIFFTENLSLLNFDFFHWILFSIYFYTLILYFSFVGLYDLKYMVVESKAIVTGYILFGLGFVSSIILSLCGFLYYGSVFIFFSDHVLTALVIGVFFYTLYKFTKGIGFGDVLLAPLIGLALGVRNGIVALYISYMSGAVIGVYLLIRGKKEKKSPLPFIPFLAIGVIVAILYSKAILSLAIFDFIRALN